MIVSKKCIFRFALFALGFFCLGCTYRFTNIQAKAPAGINSIAVEAIYDTTQKVIPHEILWESLQREFIKDGRLKVTDSDSADAYLKLQIIAFDTSLSVESDIGKKEDDITGELSDLDSVDPRNLRNLNIASTIAEQESQQFIVQVEIWDLNNQQLLHKKNYQASSGLYRIHDNTTTHENRFLRAEEAMKVGFQNAADNLARNVVRDFIRVR